MYDFGGLWIAKRKSPVARAQREQSAIGRKSGQRSSIGVSGRAPAISFQGRQRLIVNKRCDLPTSLEIPKLNSATVFRRQQRLAVGGDGNIDQPAICL